MKFKNSPLGSILLILESNGTSPTSTKALVDDFPNIDEQKIRDIIKELVSKKLIINKNGVRDRWIITPAGLKVIAEDLDQNA